MEDILLLDAIERYKNGEMTAQEITFFEELRKTNPEIDQLVVEHNFFATELEQFGQYKNFKHSLHEVETKMIAEGIIKQPTVKGKAKVIQLWSKYKRVAGLAAGIASIVSVLTVGVSSMFNKTNNADFDKLSRELENLKKGQNKTTNELNAVKGTIEKISPNATPKSGGTGFLVDGKGYLVTNSHVLQGKTIIATNATGDVFVAKLCVKDESRDIAILKIDDKDFKPYNTLPYSISKNINVAAPIFTMGYPKDEIVYNEGYLSSKTGYKSDTLSYQISINAEHGNSGGPVLNKFGDVVGVITKKLDGSVYAVKSTYIINAVESLKKQTEFTDIKLNSSNTIKNLNREDQFKKINNCVFLIKSYE